MMHPICCPKENVFQRTSPELGSPDSKVYEVDPFICSKCHCPMRIISFIEELDIIEKILRHLDSWDIRNHDPPEKVSDYIFFFQIQRLRSLVFLTSSST